jgi:hypothetical protein
MLAVAVVAAVSLVAEPIYAIQGQEPSNADRPAASTAPRVRTEDPALSMLILWAIGRSPTFRRLVDAVQATDGVVYVQRGRCGHHVRACLPLWMTVAGPNRILRVVVEDNKTDGEAMASVAHELWHALEVLHDPSVRTGYDMYFFYKLGQSIPGELIRGETFETKAAIEAGYAVYKELKHSRQN